MASLSREERRRQLLAKYPPPPLWKRFLNELPYTCKNVIYTICRWLWLKSLGPWIFVKQTRGPEEVASLRFVHAHTSIPVPRVYGTINFWGKSYAFMQRLPGKDILRARWSQFTDSEKLNIHTQLRGFVAELRAIPPPPSPAICSVLGGPGLDYRLCTDGPHGPYADEAEMNFQLRLGVPFDDIRRAFANESPQRAEDIIESHSPQHNIMVDNGEVTGIVDWECSGWYPRHWEYLKALFTEPCDVEWRSGIHNFLTPFQYEANVDARFGWGSPKWKCDLVGL
ncbi:kinase-like protein [Armillaria novae-zelandiae]|uniref:Kinase-like protein n=1 Tax=Armillaria novae-zelandiae TaxID=153914 RepID=A0AA39PEK0_9AGAR|nr:kinase-like protein [Armillaria novae-zelandiae]